MEEMKDKTVAELEDLAIDQDYAAARELENRYRNGIGVKKDDETADRFKQMADDLSDQEEPEEDTELDEETEESNDALEDNDLVEEDNTESKMGEDNQDAVSEENWEKWRESDYSNMSILYLRRESDESNPYAKMALADKYIDAGEKDFAIKLMEESRQITEQHMSKGSDKSAADLLVHVLLSIGKLSEEAGDGNKAFKCYQDVYEINHQYASELARCYEKGIGCKQDINKSRELLKEGALHNGTDEKVNLGIEMIKNNHKVDAAEMFQEALYEADGSTNDMIVIAKYLLAYLDETDDKGEAIDRDTIGKELQEIANKGNTLAAEVLENYK